ncbi:MAG: DUF3078 domain-containing protein [Melioribacteraceae bacterium]|nr:DUF3078 domain-containing protein [Melioribacteraceae bacterium]
MKNILLILLLTSGLILSQQKDSTESAWRPEFVSKAYISQIAFKDWAKGGSDSFTWTLIEEFALNKKTEKWDFENELKLAFGRTKSGNEAFRTNNNELYLESVFSLNVGWDVDPYISNTLKTQLTEGYNYKVEPAEKIAGFFDPGFITQGLGFTYDRVKDFKVRCGLALQEVITDKYRSYSDDKDTEDVKEAFKFETGLETVTSGKVNLAENIDLKSQLSLFTRFEQIEVWDVRWDSSIIAKVNSFLNINLNVLLIYEKNQSLRTQIKEALQVGIVYNVI